MGGNTRAIDRETGEVIAHAEKIDLRRVGRRAFRSDVCNALAFLDDRHVRMSDEHLWPDDKFATLITEGLAFNGSSEHLFGVTVSDSELEKYKPVFGDIDVTVPHERLLSLFALLGEHENKDVTSKIRYVGQNKPDQHGHQINALFQYSTVDGPLMVQIDFEGTEYVNGKPTPFSKFAHSSAWADIQIGLKGVGHKYWLVNLVRAISENETLIQLTDKSPETPTEARLKKMSPGEHPHTHAFSVDRGLRNKLKPVVFNGTTLKIDGKTAVKELPTSDSEYIRDLPSIYEFLFVSKPTKSELDKLWSLTGLVDLCKIHLTESKIKRAYVFMLNENLFGPAAQKLDRISRDVDLRTKMQIVSFLCGKFPYLYDIDTTLVKLTEQYYRMY